MEAGYDYEWLCIGSGPAGQRAAVQAAKLGKRVAVIERRHIAGGVCVDTGTIPSKRLREAVISLKRSALRNGSYRHSISDARANAQALFSRVAEVEQSQTDVAADQLRRNEVTVLIAVGTIPALPPGASIEPDLVVTSDEPLQLTCLPRRLAVVEAGIIGIEYASMFAALGVEVTVVDKREKPLEFLDEELIDELLHQMRNTGVTFRLGETVTRLEIIEEHPRRVVILLESGKRLASALVLFSAGQEGATKRLNLAAAGLEADERGRLAVDQHYRTAVPHIFASGDVIGFLSLAATSAEQGRLAACHAFRVEAGPMVGHFPIGVYTIPEVSTVGEPEHVLTAKKVPYESGAARYREIARGHRADSHRPGGLGMARRTGVLSHHRVQLPHLGRVLQGRRTRCLQQTDTLARGAGMALFDNVRFIRLGWWGFQRLTIFVLVIAGLSALSDAAQSAPPVETAPGPAPRNATDSQREGTVTGDARVGKGLFEKHCVTCHGPRGQGDGLKIVGAEVADLTSATTQRKLSADLLKTIHEGRPEKVMPSWKLRLSEQQAKDVLAYVRTLKR